MRSTRTAAALALGLVVGIVLGAGAVNFARGYDAHYEPGFARIDGYSVDTSGQTLVLSTPVGAGDVLLGHDLKETSDSVIVTVHSSVYVPGRNGFKNLSATLDTTRVVLTQPLGTRQVIDGATGRTVARTPGANAPRTLVARSEAIADALRLQRNAGARTTRIEAKLVSFKEWEDASVSGHSFVTNPDTLVWVVAIEGSGLYCGMGGLVEMPPCRLVFSVEAANPPEQAGALGGNSQGWPMWFDRLAERNR